MTSAEAPHEWPSADRVPRAKQRGAAISTAQRIIGQRPHAAMSSRSRVIGWSARPEVVR